MHMYMQPFHTIASRALRALEDRVSVEFIQTIAVGPHSAVWGTHFVTIFASAKPRAAERRPDLDGRVKAATTPRERLSRLG